VSLLIKGKIILMRRVDSQSGWPRNKLNTKVVVKRSYLRAKKL
jgi:hypothetical protein